MLISGVKNKNSPYMKREGLAEKRRKIPVVRRGSAYTRGASFVYGGEASFSSALGEYFLFESYT
jgi:hypothetical protein